MVTVMTISTPTNADVNLILLDPTARHRLMTVLGNQVRIMELVMMESTPTLVRVPVDSLEFTVRQPTVVNTIFSHMYLFTINVTDSNNGIRNVYWSG